MPTITPVNFRACLITEPGGASPESLNREVYSGVLQSVVVYGVERVTMTTPATAPISIYRDSLKKLVSRHCNVIFTIGDHAAAATRDIAQAYPKVNFVLVDGTLKNSSGTELTLPNVITVRFDIAQAAFLAGYLAAATTKTGKVATYGAINTESVVSAMSGFKQGVRYYNVKHSASVQALGVTSSAVSGWTYSGSFSNVAASRSVAERLYKNGADIVLAVAGRAGLGALEAADTAEGRFVIGVGADWFNLTNLTKYQAKILASITKSMADQVSEIVGTTVAGNFGGNTASTIGNLSNSGVTLTAEHLVPYPSGVAAELADLRDQIIAGTLAVKSPFAEVLP